MIHDILSGRKTIILATQKSVEQLVEEVSAAYQSHDLKPEKGIWPQEFENTDFVPRVYFANYIPGVILKKRDGWDKLVLVIHPKNAFFLVAENEKNLILHY